MNLVIFDVDGTLMNTNSIDDACFVKAFADAHAITGISSDWAAYPHTTDSGITLDIFRERFGRAPEADEMAKLTRCFIGLLSEQYQSNSAHFAEIPGAADALNLLQQESAWAIAIATGSWRESALLKLKAAGVKIDGIPVAVAEDGVSREEIIQAAVSKAKAYYRQSEFEKIVSVGDAIWDVHAAARSHIAFLGVGSGESEAKMRQAGARHIVKDFADFAQLMRCLNEAEVPQVE